MVGVEPSERTNKNPPKKKKEAAAKSISAARRTNTEKFTCGHVNGVGAARLTINKS